MTPLAAIVALVVLVLILVGIYFLVRYFIQKKIISGPPKKDSLATPDGNSFMLVIPFPSVADTDPGKIPPWSLINPKYNILGLKFSIKDDEKLFILVDDGKITEIHTISLADQPQIWSKLDIDLSKLVPIEILDFNISNNDEFIITTAANIYWGEKLENTIAIKLNTGFTTGSAAMFGDMMYLLTYNDTTGKVISCNKAEKSIDFTSSVTTPLPSIVFSTDKKLTFIGLLRFYNPSGYFYTTNNGIYTSDSNPISGYANLTASDGYPVDNGFYLALESSALSVSNQTLIIYSQSGPATNSALISDSFIFNKIAISRRWAVIVSVDIIS